MTNSLDHLHKKYNLKINNLKMGAGGRNEPSLVCTYE
jgi:hypothetical protein